MSHLIKEQTQQHTPSKLYLSLLCLMMLTLSFSTQAKIYKCYDENGAVYYSQSYDPKKCTGGGATLNERGMTIDTIERQKTSEELQAEKQEALEIATQKRKEEEKKYADHVLLISYATEDDLRRALQEQIDTIDQSINTSKILVNSQQKSLADLLTAAADAERAGKPIPEKISTQIAEVRAQIDEQNMQAEQKEKEKEIAIQNMENEILRYNELKMAREKK